MFKIIDYKSINKCVPDKGIFVHPFYRDTFAKLYGVDADTLINADEATPEENLNVLLPLLKKVSKGYEDKICCFFDVRISEEFGYPAPEYLLLHRIGLRKVSPISVKGMQGLSLPFSLHLAEIALKDGEYGLLCCADLNTPFDDSTNYYAGTILLQKTNEKDLSGCSEDFIILAYSHDLTKEAFDQYKKEHHADVINAGESDISMIFSILSCLKTECIIAWNVLGHYGFIHLRKGL